MYQPVTLFIGFRYLYSSNTTDYFSRVVAWFSTVGILLGVAALVVVLSVMNGFEEQLVQRVLQVIPHVLVTTPQQRLDPQQFPSTMIQALHLNDLHTITPLNHAEVVLQSRQGITVANMLGVAPTAHEPLAAYLIRGNLQSLQPKQWRVILGVQLAQQLGVRLGDSVRLVATNAGQFTPFGQLPSQRLFTVAGFFAVGSTVDGTQLLVNEQDAARLLCYPPGWISAWRLFFNQPLAVATAASVQLPKGLVWQDWYSSQGTLFQALRIEKIMMGLLLALLVIVGLFNLLTALVLQVMQRSAEVAILQTQGATHCQIVQLLMLQGMSHAVMGTVLGGGMGLLLACWLNELLQWVGIEVMPGATLPIVIDLRQVMGIVLMTLLMALLTTLYPAWRAAKADPIQGLQYAE